MTAEPTTRPTGRSTSRPTTLLDALIAQLKRVRTALSSVRGGDDALVDRVLALVKSQHDY